MAWARGAAMARIRSGGLPGAAPSPLCPAETFLHRRLIKGRVEHRIRQPASVVGAPLLIHRVADEIQVPHEAAADAALLLETWPRELGLHGGRTISHPTHRRVGIPEADPVARDEEAVRHGWRCPVPRRVVSSAGVALQIPPFHDPGVLRLELLLRRSPEIALGHKGTERDAEAEADH